MTPRSYGISPRRRNVLVAIWLLLTLPLALGGLASDPALLIAAAIVTVILVPIFALAIGSARLRVSDDGIELHQLGWRVSTPWDNIAGVRLVRGREGLVLHQPLAGKGAERLAAAAGMRFSGASFYDAEQQRLIAEQRFIPVEAFAYWFDHGDLHAILAERVPSLSAPEALVPSEPTKLTRRNLVITVAIIIAALAAGIVLAFATAETQARTEQLLAIPLALAMAVYGVANTAAAVRHLRGRRYGWFALWTALAIVQALIVVAIIGQLLPVG